MSTPGDKPGLKYPRAPRLAHGAAKSLDGKRDGSRGRFDSGTGVFLSVHLLIQTGLDSTPRA